MTISDWIPMETFFHHHFLITYDNHLWSVFHNNDNHGFLSSQIFHNQWEIDIVLICSHHFFSALNLAESGENQWPWRSGTEKNWRRYRFHICLAYFSGLCIRGYPHNSYGQKYGTVMYSTSICWILEISHWFKCVTLWLLNIITPLYGES